MFFFFWVRCWKPHNFPSWHSASWKVFILTRVVGSLFNCDWLWRAHLSYQDLSVTVSCQQTSALTATFTSIINIWVPLQRYYMLLPCEFASKILWARSWAQEMVWKSSVKHLGSIFTEDGQEPSCPEPASSAFWGCPAAFPFWGVKSQTGCCLLAIEYVTENCWRVVSEETQSMGWYSASVSQSIGWYTVPLQPPCRGWLTDELLKGTLK